MKENVRYIIKLKQHNGEFGRVGKPNGSNKRPAPIWTSVSYGQTIKVILITYDYVVRCGAIYLPVEFYFANMNITIALLQNMLQSRWLILKNKLKLKFCSHLVDNSYLSPVSLA